MNYHSLLNGIFDWFIGIFDNIPKAVYFFFACFTSGVDALQCLVRKLAGLDTYYTKSNYSSYKKDESTVGNVFWSGSSQSSHQNLRKVTGRDPLSEFVYGILGIGDNTVAYKALNTVFWSLSIFSLILLALSTMVAMIKSHYSEDYQNTNPWKYIYAAIKAFLTYAIMPAVVVIGLALSTFILQTLDNITAGNGEEKIRSVYGTNAMAALTPTTDDSGKKLYGNYDFFGAGSATNSTTFGGMLFQAAGYSSNRLRKGEITIKQMQNFKINGNQLFGGADCNGGKGLGSFSDSADRTEYLAYQVDFAFMNNLKCAKSKSMGSINSDLEGAVRWTPGLCFIGGNPDLNSFSKYHVTAIWFFYDLWSFNYIVGFGGAVSTIGLLISIILGLMSRLIKGAALFLLYPPLLSIAPLDNFKAFKSWGTTFMQQILMAYGAIVGMNLVMLILPIVQNFSWFGPGMGVIDAIVNMIILIVGICMMKEFIGIVSGFIGGADAASTGEGLKANVASTIKQGAGKAIAVGGAATRVLGTAGYKLGKGIGKHFQRKRIESAFENDKKDTDNLRFIKGRDKNFNYKEGVRGLTTTAETIKVNGKNTSLEDLSKMSEEDLKKVKMTEDQKVMLSAYKEARKSGKNEENASQAAREAFTEHLKNTESDTRGKDGKFLSRYEEAQQKESAWASELKDKNENAYKSYVRHQKMQDYTEQAKNGTLKGFKVEKGEDGKDHIRRVNRHDPEGNKYTRAFTKEGAKENLGKIWGGIKGVGKAIDKEIDGASIGKRIADGFLKSLKQMGSGTGLDKMLGGMKGMMSESMTFKGGVFKPEPEGDALARKNAADAQKASEREVSVAKETNALLKEMLKKQEVTNATNRSIQQAIQNGLGKTYGSGSDKSSRD